MKTIMKNENTAARKLTLEEIESLPRGSVIWEEMRCIDDDGIVFAKITPSFVYIYQGKRWLFSGDDAGNWDREVTRNEAFMFDDQFGIDLIEYWDREPEELPLGITSDEYDNVPGWLERKVVFPKLAFAITSRRMTFESFCNKAGLDLEQFYDLLTGKRNTSTSGEMLKIMKTLQITDDELTEIFR